MVRLQGRRIVGSMRLLLVPALLLVPLAQASALVTPPLVAYSNGNAVVVSAPDWSGAVTLPGSGPLAVPAWSPDGKRTADRQCDRAAPIRCRYHHCVSV